MTRMYVAGSRMSEPRARSPLHARADRGCASGDAHHCCAAPGCRALRPLIAAPALHANPRAIVHGGWALPLRRMWRSRAALAAGVTSAVETRRHRQRRRGHGSAGRALCLQPLLLLAGLWSARAQQEPSESSWCAPDTPPHPARAHVPPRSADAGNGFCPSGCVRCSPACASCAEQRATGCPLKLATASRACSPSCSQKARPTTRSPS